MRSTEDTHRIPLHRLLERFGKRLAAFRVAQRLKQADLADRAGVSVPTIQRLESGRSGSLDTLARVLRALEIEHRLLELIPDATISPLDPLAARGKQRKRVRDSAADDTEEPWHWGGESS